MYVAEKSKTWSTVQIQTNTSRRSPIRGIVLHLWTKSEVVLWRMKLWDRSSDPSCSHSSAHLMAAWSGRDCRTVSCKVTKIARETTTTPRFNKKWFHTLLSKIPRALLFEAYWDLKATFVLLSCNDTKITCRAFECAVAFFSLCGLMWTKPRGLTNVLTAFPSS